MHIRDPNTGTLRRVTTDDVRWVSLLAGRNAAPHSMFYRTLLDLLLHG